MDIYDMEHHCRATQEACLKAALLLDLHRESEGRNVRALDRSRDALSSSRAMLNSSPGTTPLTTPDTREDGAI